jgi:hypothetical protein
MSKLFMTRRDGPRGPPTLGNASMYTLGATGNPAPLEASAPNIQIQCRVIFLPCVHPRGYAAPGSGGLSGGVKVSSAKVGNATINKGRPGGRP